MAQVFFHYSTPHGAVAYRSVGDMDDLPELCEHAARLVQTLVSAPSLEDWRHWVLHVRDDLGAELFEMPFSSLLGKPH